MKAKKDREIVQMQNPRTGRWMVVEKKEGKIGAKSYAKPLKNVPIVNNNSANYIHTDPDSFHFGSIDMIIEWLKYPCADTDARLRDILTKLLQRTKLEGYELIKQIPQLEACEIKTGTYFPPEPVRCVPLMLCPKCNGQKIVAKPPWINTEQMEWVSDGSSYQCDVCNGTGVIPMQIIENPSKEKP